MTHERLLQRSEPGALSMVQLQTISINTRTSLQSQHRSDTCKLPQVSPLLWLPTNFIN